MSEVTENTPVAVPTAGNTVSTLAPIDRDAAAATSNVAEEAVNVAPVVDETVPVTSNVEEMLDEENTFDVNRAEFNELRDLVLSLRHGIETFNTGAPHKIPLVSINAVLGIR